jgi:hypothetical protein
MSGGIFLIQSGDLVEMKEQPYDTENVLQELLAKYPNLLAGDQMDGAAPRRWLLISREMGVPSEEQGGDRWSLDHLFLDQDAIPTLIEVKRSSDTRIRREVIGQLLDYAANAVVYWPVEAVRARFEECCRQGGPDPARDIETLLGPGADMESFWQRVKTNLQAGRIRMVFVADVIPPELRRVVEFLNSQMDPAEVLAVEIKQFVGQGLKTLVPRVIGLTSEAERKKGAEKQWDEASFFEDLRQRRGQKEVEAARGILAWAKKCVPRIWWGKGKRDGSFFPMLDHNGEKYHVTAVWTYGRATIPFKMMLNRKPFDDETKRLELRDRFNKIPGIKIPADAISLYPSVPLSALTTEVAMKEFLAVLDWYIAEVKAA